jgi:hypothetical protein
MQIQSQRSKHLIADSRSKFQKACQHFNRTLLVKFGLAPWRLLCEQAL